MGWPREAASVAGTRWRRNLVRAFSSQTKQLTPPRVIGGEVGRGFDNRWSGAGGHSC